MDWIKRLIKEIQFSILLSTDDSVMCKELSHNIEDALAQTDWESLLEERRQREMDDQRRRENSVYRCLRCFQEFLGCDLIALPGIGYYCRECAETRLCVLCGNLLTTENKKSSHTYFCKQCHNAERVREWSRVRQHLDRARRIGQPATLTLRQWLETIAYFERKCAYCLTERFDTLDHFVPLELGGGTTVGNCVPACKRCNQQKGRKNPNVDPIDSLVTEPVKAYLVSKSGQGK